MGWWDKIRLIRWWYPMFDRFPIWESCIDPSPLPPSVSKKSNVATWKIPALNGGVKLGICHRIIWRASSRGVASNDLELENAKGIPRESDKELKESKQKLQNARKIQSYSAWYLVLFGDLTTGTPYNPFKIYRRNRECWRKFWIRGTLKLQKLENQRQFRTTERN